MQPSNLKTLIQRIFMETLFCKVCVSQGITLGILLCTVLNIGWAVFHIKTLDQIRILTRFKMSSDFAVFLSEYLRSTLVCLGLRYGCHITYSFVAEKLSRVLMAQFLLESMQMNYTDFVKNDPGKTVSIIQNKIYVYRNVIDVFLFKCTSLGFFFVCTAAKMYKTASGGFVSTIPLLILFLYPAAYICLDVMGLSRKLRSHTRYVEEKRKNSSNLLDKIRNLDIIKSYGIEREESECLYEELSHQRLCLFWLKLIHEKNSLFSSCFSEISSISLLYLMRYVHPLNQYNCAITYILTFRSLGSLLNEVSSSISSLVLSVNELMIDDVPLSKKTSDDVEVEFNNTIEFRNVCLYHDEKLIIEGIDVVIQKGESVAIVGSNGTGKSTFIRSLLGFTKYTGDILVDGFDIKKAPNRSMLKMISYVSQDNYIMDCTVLDNIKLGNKRSTKEEIESKAKLFDANETLLQLENGYGTKAGAGGINLSAGQKQKISLVRAAIRDAPIFILDEATAAMDKKYEKKVLHTILTEFAEKTILMIIHSKDYLKDFDRIIFFSSGKLGCVGSYKDLMRTSQDFRRFMSFC